MNAHHHAVVVTESSQPYAVRAEARKAAERLRFTDEDAYRTELVATELATNLVKHTTAGGEVLVRGITDSTGGAVELLAVDRGPGMADTAACLSDGQSTAGSMGSGLGAIRRLSDEFDIHSEPGRGTAILARVRAERSGTPRDPLVCAGVSVPYDGEPVCGDAWAMRTHESGFTVMVVDGLGHGLPASAAARSALDIFDTRAYSSASEMLRHIHHGLAHTRGAAATIVDVRPGEATAIVAGIGNVATVLANASGARSGVALPGILGHQARQFREFTYPWSQDTLLVLHSDGLTTRWSIDAYRGLHPRHPALIASVLYRDCTRGRDDATVVVVKAA